MRATPSSLVLLAAAATLVSTAGAALVSTAGAESAPEVTTEATIGDYYSELQRLGLIDVETGTKDALIRELGAAEKLLQDGSPIEAAVALYAIVESPRFTDFDDFVEYHNAEYSLAVSLAAAGAYDSALMYLVRVMERGPSKLYFAPAHRRAVDIAIESRDYGRVLAMLEGLELNEPVAPGPIGERAYLRARAAYDVGDFAAAEGELVKISRKSRLFTSALYMRGVIRARRGENQSATDALCEIVDTPDNDRYTFVVDDRYFTIKDLARLGLGRIAHEDARYDDAYYHYFQIPDDSDRLPEALFEAAWSMYQKRELPTARDLVEEFLDNFPSSPLAPEAMLLAGYIELADCEFVTSQRYFDRIVKRMQPVADELDRIREDEDRRARLFDRALTRWRDERADPGKRLEVPAKKPFDEVLALLRLDPKFVRMHEAVQGMKKAKGDAPHVVRAWRTLARRVSKTQVGATSAEPSIEHEDAADANGLLEDVKRLRDDVDRARSELRRGVRAGTLPEDVAAEETKRLSLLESEIDLLEKDAEKAAEEADAALMTGADPQVAHLIRQDLQRARDLQATSEKFLTVLVDTTDQLAVDALDRLYLDLRRVLDKAKLGKIDAVIGQKLILDIEVTDLSSGRFPPELHGKLWEQGLIGDDEELWPFEGEMWKDEYEGWR